MQEVIRIGMSEYKVSRAPGQIITLGLGSCIGVCAYERESQIGGMIHIMLPSSTIVVDDVINHAKFADTGIPLLISEMEKLGAKRELIEIKIAGGAEMFSGFEGRDDHLRIGQKNINAVEETCKKLGIPIVAQSVGGNSGKSITFDLSTGMIEVKTLNEVSTM